MTPAWTPGAEERWLVVTSAARQEERDAGGGGGGGFAGWVACFV